MEIIGREEELEVVESFVARAEDGAGALVLSGEPGIGKTVLWEAGVEVASSSCRLLVHRSAEAEASLSFTGLSDLLTPVFDEVASSLAPFRRRALEVALLLAEPGEEVPDPRTIGVALLDVLRALAEDGPVIVALDDVQWLDPPSAGVLQIALRRLGDERVRLLATVRRTRDAAGSGGLVATFKDDRQVRLELGPLSLGALHRLLKDRIGLELTRPELARVQEASAGNPFFALELGRELVRTGTRPEGGHALRVPESLRELLGGRLARLPTETGDVVLFVAALARPTVELVAAAHGDREGVLDALDIAVREGVVELDGSRLRFSHPLLASISYEQAPIWKRGAVHRALAGAVSDAEEGARHRALAAEGPDAAVAGELDDAAEHAAVRGATASAAVLAELAAELTPADAVLARHRRRRAATLYRLSGDGEKATVLLEQLLTEVPSEVERSDLLFELGTTIRADRLRAVALYDEALAEVGADDLRSARILARRSLLQLLGTDVHAALADARAALDRAERAGEASLVAVAIARLAHAEAIVAEITPGLLERGVEIEERLGLRLEYYESPRFLLGRSLGGFGEIDRACAIFDGLIADAEAWGDEGTRVAALWYRAMAEWIVGRLQDAYEHATTAEELGELIQFSHAGGWVGRVKVYILADLGLVEEARASGEEALAFARATANESYLVTTLAALGRLELMLGNLEAAGGYLRDLPERAASKGWNDPGQHIVPDAIETLIALGDRARARAYLDRYAGYAVRNISPLAVERAERCRGLLAASSGDFEEAFAAFDRALVEPEAHPYRLEHGRTLLCLGAVRRQALQRKAAREALEQALAIFEELGARPWAEKARAELGRISGRTPASEELTGSERRVAELAARGSSNREIAAELYMGVSTVEAHLSRVYRKLGVRRAGLAVRLAETRDGAVKARDEAAQS
jgi:DNA-binding CsgD family transcriptional regulator